MTEVIHSTYTPLLDDKQYFAYNSGKKEDIHVINNMDHYNKTSENKYLTRKASKVSPSELENLVQSQGGEKNIALLVNLTTLPKRKKSILSNVSYSSESNQDEENTPPVTPTEDTTCQQQSFQRSYSWMSCINNGYISDESTEPMNNDHLKKRNKKKQDQVSKKSSWFTDLFQKQCKNLSKEKSPKNTFSISNFFSLKKKTRKEQAALLSQQQLEKKDSIPFQLPIRYPITVERVIYRLSNVRLSNARRPLRHQVVISNMLSQYHNLIQSQKETLVFSGRLQYANTLIYHQQQGHLYIPSNSNK